MKYDDRKARKNNPFVRGERVFHTTFGVGRVVSAWGKEVGLLPVIVEFDRHCNYVHFDATGHEHYTDDEQRTSASHLNGRPTKQYPLPTLFRSATKAAEYLKEKDMKKIQAWRWVLISGSAPHITNEHYAVNGMGKDGKTNHSLFKAIGEKKAEKIKMTSIWFQFPREKVSK